VLTLTAKGDKSWQRLMQVIERRNAEMASCLDARERQQFSQLLDRLVEHARSTATNTDE
jgi:DNA-binding MarR family transcriptional regulator